MGASILFHVGIAAGLVLAIQIPRLIEPPAVQVSLVPPLPAELTPRVRHPAPPAPPRTKAPLVAPRAAPIIGPAPLAPLPIPAAPPDEKTREALFNAPFVAPRDSLHQGLRTGAGCTDADAANLTPSEREECRQHNHALGEGAPSYAVGPSDAGQRAWLDKQAAKNDKRERRAEAPPERPMGACNGIEGQLGCALPSMDEPPPSNLP